MFVLVLCLRIGFALSFYPFSFIFLVFGYDSNSYSAFKKLSLELEQNYVISIRLWLNSRI
eukprot:snap_masked-scaffold_37-processed-gene-1.8-mRNA-1 protein AED:1.00 eAED:1.00 QI:0/0/0/0/1/1/2/0/59